MKKKTIFGLIGLVVLVFIGYFGFNSVNSGTKSSSSSTDEKQIIRVSTTGVSFPGSYKDGDTLTGFDVEVIKAAADKIGYDIEFTTVSFDGLFGQLTSGKVDAVASSIAITAERKELYDFTTPYATFQYGVTVRKDSDLKSIDELSGRTLAATVGSNQIKVVNAYNPEIKIQTFDDREAALSGVTNGQVDGYSNAKTIISAIIKQKNLDLRILDGSLGEENIAIAFVKGENEELRQKINNAIEELIEDGTVSELSEKFFSGVDAAYKLN